MKRLRKESEQDGNSEKTHKGCRPGAATAEPRNHDDLGLPLTARVIGRAHLKPLLVTRSSGDVEIFDRFILQLLRAKGIAGEPADPTQVTPMVCLTPFRPMFVTATPSSSDGGGGGTGSPKPTEDEGIKKIWRISPVYIRNYIEDLLMQPILLETFISRGRDLGLADVGQSVLHAELFRMVQLLDMAAAEDLASLESEEKEMVREERRRRCAAARQAAKLKETTSAAAAAEEAAAAAAAAAAATGGLDAFDECLPRCEDLIIIGIGIGKGGSGKDTDDLAKRGTSDDDLRRRRKEGKTGGTGDGQVDGQGDGQGAGQGAGGAGIGDSSLGFLGDDGRKGKKGKKKKKKKKKGGKGGGGSEDGDGDGEEEGEGDDHGKEGGDHDGLGDDDDDYDYDYDDDGGHGTGLYDHDHDGAGTAHDDQVDWDSKLKDEIIPVPQYTPSFDRPSQPSLATFVLPPRGSMLPRGSMYSLQFTPAFVFSYFQTMPPHYNDDAQLLVLFDRYGGNRRTKGKK